MYKIYQETPFPQTQFNYFADPYKNPMQNCYFTMNQQQLHAPQYILPYAGVDLRCLQWSKVIEILEKQAESYKLFQLNAAYGYDWANEQNFRHILEFNAQFRKEIELMTDDQSMEQLPVFQLPTFSSYVVESVPSPAPLQQQQKQQPMPTKKEQVIDVQGSRKRKRTTTNKKATAPKKSKKVTFEPTVIAIDPDNANFSYRPAVSPISPNLDGSSCDGNVFYDSINLQ